jgi:hypothetical protein
MSPASAAPCRTCSSRSRSSSSRVPGRRALANAGDEHRSEPDLPEPTGRRCDVPGLDVMTVGPEGITSIVGYFDQKTFTDQLGP